MRVADLRAESHRNDVIGIGETAPRLSWITETDTPSWRSAGYEVEIDGRSTGRVESDESIVDRVGRLRDIGTEHVIFGVARVWEPDSLVRFAALVAKLG